MQRKKCFGSIKQVQLDNGMAMTQTQAECRDCEDFRDCLFDFKSRDEAKKQDVIATIIDHSDVHSNEVGSCLLDFLNRMYNHPVGASLFKDLILFHETVKGDLPPALTIPLSPSLLQSVMDGTSPFGDSETHPPEGAGSSERNLLLRIILLQKNFPNNRKANIGVIAHQVATLFASNEWVGRTAEALPEEDAKVFRKMDARLRINWMVEKWGFKDEHEAFQVEVNRLGGESSAWGR
jgi:hypothetical protein